MCELISQQFDIVSTWRALTIDCGRIWSQDRGYEDIPANKELSIDGKEFWFIWELKEQRSDWR